MEKRGQVTIYIMIGVFILLVVLLIFFLKGDVLGVKKFLGFGKVKNTDLYLKDQMTQISNEVNRCVDLEAGKALKILGDQGGYFVPENYLFYYGYNIAYLCSEIKDKNSCLNNMLLEERLENDLNLYLKDKLKDCINLGKFEKYDYKLEYDKSNFNVNTDINKRKVKFEVSIPVMISMDETKLSKDSFIRFVNVPFGDVILVTNNILNSEVVYGDFDTVSYTIFKLGEYNINKRRVFPDKIYTVKVEGYDYRFQFAIKGAE